MRQVVPDSSNVDEKAACRIDPPCVYDIEFVRLLSVDVVRVHLQHVISTLGDARRPVVEDGHIVVGAEIMDSSLGHLDIGICIPRQDLLAPPPAKQRAMHQPRLDTEVREGGQVGLQEILQGSLLLMVWKGLFCKAAIVMRMEDRLVEVFLGWVVLSCAHVFVQPCPYLGEVCVPMDRREGGYPQDKSGHWQKPGELHRWTQVPVGSLIKNSAAKEKLHERDDSRARCPRRTRSLQSGERLGECLGLTTAGAVLRCGVR